MLTNKVCFPLIIFFLVVTYIYYLFTCIIVTWLFLFLTSKKQCLSKKLECPLENCWLGQNAPQKWNPRSDTDILCQLNSGYFEVGTVELARLNYTNSYMKERILCKLPLHEWAGSKTCLITQGPHLLRFSCLLHWLFSSVIERCNHIRILVLCLTSFGGIYQL